MVLSKLNDRVAHLKSLGTDSPLAGSLTGLEKESLRVDEKGCISQRSHPESLGSALKHPWITTDYSEALLELITPPCDSSQSALEFLRDIESYVYQRLDKELLWTSSMPCIVNAENDIRIAEYGSSNAGRMKHVYRHGLAWRYGKMMQVIAGIHFNHSMAPELWPVLQALDANKDSEQDYISAELMAMTRNIQRYGWLIPLLFGCSPAICKTFLAGNPPIDSMEVYNKTTFYERWGTSLRMGDIGYTNRKSSKVGIKADYSSVASYTASLEAAIETSYSGYEEIGVEVDGEHRQLNTNILQIENEYYSTVRPKRVLQGFEKPIDALRQRGVQYVELRSVDINAFHPAGISANQLCYLEVFMLFCLLADSPAISATEVKEIDHNQSTVAHQGRKPGLELQRNGEKVSLCSWGSELSDAMRPVAELLDTAYGNKDYSQALESHQQMIDNPDLTPSATALRMITEQHDSYYDFANAQSQMHRDYFMERKLSDEAWNKLADKTTNSLQAQAALEAEPQLPFGQFLQRYFDGTLQ